MRNTVLPPGSPKALGVIERFTTAITNWVGSVPAFSLALLVVVIWAATGPCFGFSDTWQLVINTSTTIVTFLMVFLIQRSQNKDTLAIQLKLNEIIAAHGGASNHLIDIESLSEEEVRRLHARYARLAKLTLADKDPGAKHSVEDCEDWLDERQGEARPAAHVRV